MNPGDTGWNTKMQAWWKSTLNEGRGVNPGDTRGRLRAARVPAALNEGRGVNPGDTFSLSQRTSG